VGKRINEPHCCNITNLHSHGQRVSPCAASVSGTRQAQRH